MPEYSFNITPHRVHQLAEADGPFTIITFTIVCKFYLLIKYLITNAFMFVTWTVKFTLYSPVSISSFLREKHNITTGDEHQSFIWGGRIEKSGHESAEITHWANEEVLNKQCRANKCFKKNKGDELSGPRHI